MENKCKCGNTKLTVDDVCLSCYWKILSLTEKQRFGTFEQFKAKWGLPFDNKQTEEIE